MKLKRLFCKHDYRLQSAMIVHYPDYEAHKVGQIYKCKKCGKYKRTLTKPFDFINQHGRKTYNCIVKDRRRDIKI